MKAYVCALLLTLSLLLSAAAPAKDVSVHPRYSYESVCVPVTGTPFALYLPASWYLYTPPENSDIVFAAGVQDQSKWLFVQVFSMSNPMDKALEAAAVWLDGAQTSPSPESLTLCGLPAQSFTRADIHATGVVIRDAERDAAYLVQVMTDGDAAFAALGKEVISSICLAEPADPEHNAD